MYKISNTLRFILINVVPSVFDDRAALYDLDELKSLVETFGGATIVRIIQRRSAPDPGMYVGTGKAKEIGEMIKQEKIDVVVINDIVKPVQLFNLKKVFIPYNESVEVWDRIDLILQIFDKHAQSAESKLQIELARMRHMGPRIFGMGYVLSRQAGGIGTRGIGETNTELMKRHWRSAMKKVNDQLAKLSDDRERKLLRRKKMGFRTVSIVGYTNAGKSTLFNAITKKKKLAADVLFATLDSSLGKVYLPGIKQEVLVSDTIGFIQNLPPQLIRAFKSTLMESVHADLLLHVVDVSDSRKHEKIEVVQDILRGMGIEEKDQIIVFNKIDAQENINTQDLDEIYEKYSPLYVSAQTGANLNQLLLAIEDRFRYI